MSLFSSKATKERIPRLQRLVPLNTLSDEALAGLAAKVEFKKLKAGEYLFREGDTAPFNAYLLSGRVVLMVQEHEESRVSAASVVAKFPLAHQIPRKFSVRALSDVEVALVDRKLLDASLGEADSVNYEVDELSRLGSQDWMDKLLEARSFQGVSPDNIPKVLVNVEEMLVFSGDELINKGKHNNFFYMIHEGRAVITKWSEEEKSIVELAQLVPGDTFGGDILLSGAESDVTVSMATNGILLRMEKEVFTQFVFKPLVSEISYEDAKASQGAQWIDVRSRQSYLSGHIPGSINVPFDAVRENAPNLNDDHPCIVYGSGGREILSAAFALFELGFDVSLLKDGLKSVSTTQLVQGEQAPEPSAAIVTSQPAQSIQQSETGPSSSDSAERTQIRLEKTKQQLVAQTAALEQLQEQHKKASELWAKERGLLKDSLSKNKSQLEGLNQQLESDRSQIQQLHQERDSAVESMEKAKSELQTYRQQIADLQTEKEIEEQGLSGVTEELEQRQSALDAANEQLKKVEAERDDFRQRQEELTTQLHQHQADSASAKSEHEKLSQQLEQLSSEHQDNLKLEQDKAQQQQQLLEQQLQSAKEELEAAQKSSAAESSAAELAALKASLAETEQRSKEQEDENRRLQKQIDTQEKPSNNNVGLTTETSPSDELEALRIELDVVKTQAAMEKDELQKSLTDLKASLNIGENLDTQVNLQELDKLRQHSEGLEKQVEESNENLVQLEDSLEDKNEQIQQLENKVVEEQLLRRELQLKIDSLEQQVTNDTATEDDDSDYVEPYQVADNTSSLKPFLTGTLAGMLLLFVSLEGVTLFSGKGELLTSLVADSIQKQLPTPKVGAVQPPAKIEQVAVQEQESTEKAEPAPKQEVKPALTGTLLDDDAEGPAMIRIDAAEFVMGNDIAGLPDNEKPAHKVTLSAFAVSRTEVTFDDYDYFALETGRTLPDDNGWGRGRRPVINVSWQDAVDYTRWLSEQTGKRYRLPTEAEWEYIAQGGSETTYWWGYELGNGDANCFQCGSQWDRKSTAPVAGFQANGFGLHNTAGNVSEWVQDCYHRNYRGAPDDGTAWERDGCNERVVRGGSYDKLAKTMISSSRSRLDQKTKVHNVGFRVARDL